MFRLGSLNGGGAHGVLWKLPCGADAVFKPREVVMDLGVGGRRLGRVVLPGSAGLAATKRARERMTRLMSAYHDGDAADFARVLDQIAHNRQGFAGHPTQRDEAWLLSRWRALWVRAHLAEIRDRAENPEAWGLSIAAGHPQLRLR